MRIAVALGLPPSAFLHTKVAEAPAPIEPTTLLKESAPGYLTDADRSALATGLWRARAFTTLGDVLGVKSLADHFRARAAPEDRPHEDGYARALEVRGLVPERPRALRNLRRLLETRFDILVQDHHFADPHVLGAACRSGRARLIAVNSDLPSETARRFVLAHELAHHLLDLTEQGATADEGDYNSTRFWFDRSPTEKRANAFAAMLLVPRDALKATLGAPRSMLDLNDARAAVEKVCREFGIGFAAAAWHVYNMHHIDRGTVEALLFTAPEDRVSGFEEDTGFDGLERRAFDALANDAISRARARELVGDEIEAQLARATQ
jgi:Zn-dependent peptidase ImmA (M78 family)